METQLYYLETRYYDPHLGRFLNPDSLDYLGDGEDLNNYNLFAYCGNNPVMNKDPSGKFCLSTFFLCLGIGAVVGGILGGITAYYSEQNVLTGIFTGTLLGAAVGSVIGIGGATLTGAISSTLGKATTDLIGVAFYGGEFGSWEDYAIAFSFGGITGSLGQVIRYGGGLAKLASITKFVSDTTLRPLANQLVKLGTRGNLFNEQKFFYDVATRAATYGGSKQILKGNVLKMDLKLDVGKSFYRATTKAMYSFFEEN